MLQGVVGGDFCPILLLLLILLKILDLEQGIEIKSFLFSILLQAETLADHIKFDHGYNAKSPAIVNVCVFPSNYK